MAQKIDDYQSLITGEILGFKNAILLDVLAPGKYIVAVYPVVLTKFNYYSVQYKKNLENETDYIYTKIVLIHSMGNTLPTSPFTGRLYFTIRYAILTQCFTLNFVMGTVSIKKNYCTKSIAYDNTNISC